MPSKPHVLITGGAGFIGSFVAEELLRRGCELTLFDALVSQVHPQSQPPPYLPAAARLVVGDVRDRAALAPLLRDCDVVIHLAAAVGVAQSQYEVQHYCDVNVNGTATLCDILIKEKHRVGKVVVAGSMTAYGEGQYRRGSDGALRRPRLRSADDVMHSWELRDSDTGEILLPLPIAETAQLNSTNVYAMTKRMQEDLVLNLQRYYAIPSVALRFFNVYGPRQALSNPYTGVLAIFLARLLNNNAPLVFEDGGQSRDFIYVSDVATAVADAALGPATAATINIGSGSATAVGELARWLCRELRPQLSPELTGTFRNGDIRHCTADISCAQQLLDFCPRVSLNQGIAELLAWAARQQPEDKTAAAIAELARHIPGRQQ